MECLKRTAFCDPALLDKWNRQGQVAMAPYYDFCFNLMYPQPWRTSDYESQWWKHNVYHSLLNTDEYAWAYFEQFSFWKNDPKHDHADPVMGMAEAVSHFRKGEALGYDMCKPTDQFQFQNEQPATFFSGARIDLDLIDRGKNIELVAHPSKDIRAVEFFVNGERIGRNEADAARLSIARPASGSVIVARGFTEDNRHITSAPVLTGP
jgi:hypothetical protein